MGMFIVSLTSMLLSNEVLHACNVDSYIKALIACKCTLHNCAGKNYNKFSMHSCKTQATVRTCVIMQQMTLKHLAKACHDNINFCIFISETWTYRPQHLFHCSPSSSTAALKMWQKFINTFWVIPLTHTDRQNKFQWFHNPTART